MLQLTTNVSIYHQCVGKKTALLQAEASARVSGLANVLFCGLAVSFFFYSHCKITNVVSLFGLVGNVECMVPCGITKRFPINLHLLFLRATDARKPLKPACTIHIVCALHEQAHPPESSE